MSDSLLMLLEMIEEVLEEQALVAEGTQLGTVFEDVLVDVAKNGSLNAAHPNGGKIPPGLKKKSYNGPHKNNTLLQLSIKSLEKMGWSLEEIESGVDPDAGKPDLKEKGIDGSPKTDVLIKSPGNPKAWKISLKLPGDIQLGGAGAETSIEIFKKTLQAFGEQIEAIEEDVERKARIKLQKVLQTQLDRLTGLLEKSGGRFYPEKNYVENLTAKFTAQIQTKPEKMARLGITNAKEAEQFAIERERIFKEQGYQDWNAWNKEVKSDAQEALRQFLENKEFMPFIIDEYLTGRRQFGEGDKAIAIANAYLSPNKWVTLETLEDTKKLLTASGGAFAQAIVKDVRARGRDYLSKQVSVKIEFKEKVYDKINQQLAQAAVIQGGCNAEPDPTTMQEEVGKCQIPKTIAADIADGVKFKIDLDGKEPEQSEGT
jgi:hypothetical protein